jgi:hypothetical protein
MKQKKFQPMKKKSQHKGGSPHLSEAEVEKLEGLQKDKVPAGDALKVLKQERRKRNKAGPSIAAVYRAYSGETYKRFGKENRGRSATWKPQHLQVFDQVRLRLLRKAASEYSVTWADILEEGLRELKRRGIKPRQVTWTADTLGKLMRKHKGVRKIPGRQRISRTTDEEKARYAQGQVWGKRPGSFWSEEVHAYIDTKKFIAPTTANQRKRCRQARVYYHLRKASEGTRPEMIVPKRGRMLMGIPSVEITAAVAKNRIVMWHESKKPWNGKAAAIMYRELGQKLRRAWGQRSSYRVVEDGDPKGFQSNKGIKSKKQANIVSWKLPPRTPEWMPLDFCLWHEIEERLYKQKVKGRESLASFKARLRRTALSLPKALVAKCLASMKKRIRMTVKEKGRHLKID